MTKHALSALCVVLSNVATGAELPSEKHRWFEVESEHFTVYSSAKEKITRELVLDLERLRFVVGREFDNDIAERPTAIYVFKDARAFRPYLPLYKGKPKRASGFFRYDREGNYVAIDGSSRFQSEQSPTDIIYHEYIHYLLSLHHGGSLGR